MAEFQQVIDFRVNDHVLRNTARICRHNQELRTRQWVTCVTSRRCGHHELVCGFACRSRDVRVEKHLAPHSTCTTDCCRNGESCIGTGIRTRTAPVVLGSIKSLDHHSVDFCSQMSIPSNLSAMTSMMLSTGFRIHLSRSFALVSIARLRLPARHRSRCQPTNIHCSAAICG